jgi:uncharacterized protein YjiS (DUF1127 family)
MLFEIFDFLRAWRRYNASLKELSQLGDRELADIGISRSDIPRVAWDTANRYGVPPRHPMKAPAPCGRFRFLASRGPLRPLLAATRSCGAQASAEFSTWTKANIAGRR